MADEERKVTRYRVMYRMPSGSLREVDGEFDGPVPSALREALKAIGAVEHVSLVAVPTTNWTERKPLVQTITQISFAGIDESESATNTESTVGDGQ